MPLYLALAMVNQFELTVVRLINQASQERDFNIVVSLAKVADLLVQITKQSEELGDLLESLPVEYQAVFLEEGLVSDMNNVTVLRPRIMDPVITREASTEEVKKLVNSLLENGVEEIAEISMDLGARGYSVSRRTVQSLKGNWVRHRKPVGSEPAAQPGDGAATSTPSEEIGGGDLAPTGSAKGWSDLSAYGQVRERSQAVHSYLDRGISDARTIARELTEKGIPTNPRQVGSIKAQHTFKRLPPNRGGHESSGGGDDTPTTATLPEMTGDELRAWRRERILEYYAQGIYESKDLLPRLISLGDVTVNSTKIGTLKSFLPTAALEEAKRKSASPDNTQTNTDSVDVAAALETQNQTREDYRAAIKLLNEEKGITGYEEVKAALSVDFSNLPKVSGNVIRGLWQLENHAGPFSKKSE